LIFLWLKLLFSREIFYFYIFRKCQKIFKLKKTQLLLLECDLVSFDLSHSLLYFLFGYDFLCYSYDSYYE